MEKVKEKNQAARKFPPLCSTKGSSFNRKVMYPDVGPFSLPRLQGHSVEIKETQTFELQSLKLKQKHLETYRVWNKNVLESTCMSPFGICGIIDQQSAMSDKALSCPKKQNNVPLKKKVSLIWYHLLLETKLGKTKTLSFLGTPSQQSPPYLNLVLVPNSLTTARGRRICESETLTL